MKKVLLVALKRIPSGNGSPLTKLASTVESLGNKSNFTRLTGPNANFRMPPEYAARVFVRTIDPAYPEVAVHQFLQDFYASGISKIAPKLETLDARYWEGELERLEFLEGWEP